MPVRVHKAVEPDKLTRAGRKRFEVLVADYIQNQGKGDAVVQPKFDGVYAQFIYNAGSKTWEAFSRTGERYVSVGPSITDTFDSKAMPYLVYNGELWMPRTAHATINGLARKKSYQPSLELVLFDAFDPEAMDMPYAERRELLFDGNHVSQVRDVAPQVYVLDDLYDAARQRKQSANAYDGLILRDLQAGYVPGAGKDGGIYKIKPRASGDFRVVGTTNGIGNREGGIGALVLDLGCGKTCEVGTGLTMSDVFNPDRFKNAIVEVEYLSLTRDGLLREPVFNRIRHDKDQPDNLCEQDRGDD